MRLIASLAALVVPTLAALAFWWWQGRPLAIVDLPGGRLQCLSYTPFEGDQSPLDKDYRVSAERIRRDMAALKPYTDCLRTYSSIGTQAQVVPIAREHGMTVMAGAWISGDAETDAEEIDGVLRLAAAYPDTVSTVIVGNEVLLRREMPGDALADLIRSVKARTSKPVTYADIYEFWRRNPQVAASVDHLMLHVLPYWDDPRPVSIDRVQDHVRGIVARAQATFPGKTIVIGEIGWPSAGRTRGGAAPGRVNQARFVREFAAGAAKLGLRYNLIEAIDQPWKKGAEGTVGGFWGVLDRSREAKFPMTGPVSEWPRWPLALVFATVLSVATVLAGCRGRQRCSIRQMLALAFLGQVLGATLVFQADLVATSSRGWLGWLGGAAMAATSIAAAATAVPLIRRDGGVWATVRPATQNALLAWLRRPRLAALSPPLSLAALQAAVLVPAAIAAIALAFDPRHRDLPTPFYLIPALAFGARWLAARNAGTPAPDRREEAWLAFVLVAGGLFSLDGWQNVEAMVWTLVACALALPWLGASALEVRRLVAIVAAPRQSDERDGGRG